ncbi:hypothetical protein M6D81_03595 [Paenibacillus sp. J5C_2022]|uniref:hypothetical protein n=1 Tax=Paenibacillus sp. J5C2022 TaxID=2977129 RepID=UPI0021D2D707|nr:hypothetical protein [Paenibacillus sp. J5C2022]MCU6707785.1 hypothetical protein [Paenibacillus sp. J5C2022]
MRLARIGVLLDRRTLERKWGLQLNAWECYVTEILDRRRIPYEKMESLDELESLERLDLVIAAAMPETNDSAERLWRYATSGGLIVAYGMADVLSTKLGHQRGELIGASYIRLPERFGVKRPLRALHVSPWRREAEAAQAYDSTGEVAPDRPDAISAAPALQSFPIGDGLFSRWTIDIPATIVGLQQGLHPVLADGPPAPDGSAAINDGILKADDQIGMDWRWDRMKSDTGVPYFAHPYADLWREVLIGHLIRLCAERGLSLPFAGYWPNGVNQVALLSHDSDGNFDEHANSTLNLLEECGITSCWCMLEPGYSLGMHNRIAAAGHELAFHYNAYEVDDGLWDGSEFARQLNVLTQDRGIGRMVSNKNHITRFEAYGELFRWCEENGIEADQTRGPSKRGNVGFLFGTSHPYFPAAWVDERNRLYNVLEIGFLTQDLDIGIWADSSIIAPILDEVKNVEGVAHFLAHQVHIHNREEVRESVRKLVREARARDFAFWTSSAINEWERERRALCITGITEDGSCLVSGSAKSDAVFFVPLPQGSAVQGDEVRYGVPCRRTILSTHICSEGGISDANR